MKSEIFKIIAGKLSVRLNYHKMLGDKSWGGGTYGADIEKLAPVYLDEWAQMTKRQKKALSYDILLCGKLYGTNVQEYFCFGFMDYDNKRRAGFLTLQHKDRRLLNVMSPEKWSLLEDKYPFYQRSREFFNREVLLVTSDGRDAFADFCHRHERFIAKPEDGQCGHGVQMYSVKDDEDINKVFEQILPLNCIVEELIVQNNIMGQWNPSSVNTVRIPSFYMGSCVEVLKPFIRMGRQGAVVDNANAGGIFAIIDEKTGKINTDGYCLPEGKFYRKHPDSGMAIKGWQIPDWTDLLELAYRVHSKFPDIPYIGFDFACTDRGWVLIEGNPGQFISEFCDREGIKDKFDAVLDSALENLRS